MLNWLFPGPGSIVRAVCWYLSGVEYRLDWLLGPGAGGAATGAGVDSREAPTTQFSTAPKSGMADSEPKSSAPNWRLSPGMSVEPGISTAVEGIWRGRYQSHRTVQRPVLYGPGHTETKAQGASVKHIHYQYASM